MKLKIRQSSQSHFKAILQAFFVTFLWSSSWVLIKIGLNDLPPILFAGLRYLIAFLCLAQFVFLNKEKRDEIKSISKNNWKILLLLGLLFYAVTQGTQFIALSLLPSATVSLMLNFTTPFVAILGIFLLSEVPTKLQSSGIVLFLLGAILFLYPIDFSKGEIIGLVVAIIGVFGNAFSSLIGRKINRSGEISPLVITTVSMGIGAIVLMAFGITFYNLQTLSLSNIVIILWLAIVNTAIAFTLWNHTLRTLSATESSIINNSMLIQIAILAWIFLGEKLDAKEIIGLTLAAIGVLIVQLKIKR